MPSLKDRLREKGVNVVEFETMRTDDHQIFQETAGPRHSGAARTLDLMKTWVLGSPKQLQKMIAQGYLRGKFPIFEASAARKKEVVELVKESRVLTDLQLTFPADDAAKKPFVVATLEQIYVFFCVRAYVGTLLSTFLIICAPLSHFLFIVTHFFC
eukprot:GEMP01120275.1.p1 GENE.GEMP01120275.1~~GEMP01120275.1.p1  ORF type:complete len:156 (+),score=37.15 GEMP01120275.1:80-547(+)